MTNAITWENVSREVDPEASKVVIIGYVNCPYSAMALQLSENSLEYKDKCKFIGFGYQQPKACFQSAADFRNRFNYRGSFPVIFVKNHQGFVYVGGATDFEKVLQRKPASSVWSWWNQIAM